MAGTDVNQLLRISRSLSAVTGTPDAAVPAGNPRASRYMEQIVESVVPTKHVLADEGSYFVATNPTPGTALANTVSASYSSTVPFIYFQNKAPAGSGLRMHLDYIKIVCTTTPASGTNAQYAGILDAARAISTNNMTAIVPVSPNSDLSVQSQALVYSQTSATASALAAPSPTSRIVCRGMLGQQPLAGDELVIQFGGVDMVAYNGITATEAAGFSRRVSQSPPVIVGPQTSFMLALWFASNAVTGLSYELEMGWWER